MSEFWIHEDGGVDFADGDVGDWNHEAIVINQVQRQVIEACEQRFDIGKESTWGGRNKKSFAEDESIDWDEFLTALGTAAGEELAAKNPKWQDYIENDPHHFIPWALKQSGVKKADFDCASGKGDARDYAMEKWGWKTYRDENIDTWRITRSDLQAIIQGINEISEQDGLSDKQLARMSFTINVFSSGRHFDLTMAQMEKWLERPNSVPPVHNQDPQYNWGREQANKQVRDMDLKNMHPVYQNRQVNPFGDSVLYSFRTFLEQNP